MKHRIAVCGAIALTTLWSPAGAAAPPQRVVAHVPSFVKVATNLGPANPVQLLDLAIHLRYPDERKVARFVDAVNDPLSGSFGAFLTPGQFLTQFGPSGHTYSTVEFAIVSLGGSVVQTFPNNKVVIVAVPVAVADALFGTEVDNFTYGSATYYANAKPAYLPASLNGLVKSVSGFTDFSTTVGQPPQGFLSTGYGPAQIQTAYDEPIYQHSNLTGSGATIAIATAGDYQDGDLSHFWKSFGVRRTGKVSRIPVTVNGGARRRGRIPVLGTETTLDVEQATANAPGSNVEVYEGNDSQSTTFDAIYESIVTDQHADIVTTSFGACEPGADSSEAEADNDIFEQAAAEGQTWFAASGDNGSHDCASNAPPFGLPGFPNPNVVDFPASSPYVTAVGGTTLSLSPSGGYGGESAWSGSGGGGSAYFARPHYQDPVETLAHPRERNVPDVALDADPAAPYAFTYLSARLTIAGTSAAAPNMAAMFAQIAQALGYRLGLGQSALYYGFLTKTYPGSAWHDITKGKNGRYRAGVGYDNVTGAGSVDGNQLLLQMPPNPNPVPL